MTATILSIHRNACRRCIGQAWIDGATCTRCNGSGVIQADKAMRQHWGYRDGIAARHAGRSSDSCLFPPDTFAAHCWRAGWLEADRAASRAEKVAAEGLGAGDWIDRAGTTR